MELDEAKHILNKAGYLIERNTFDYKFDRDYVEIDESINYFDSGDSAWPSSWESIADSLQEYCNENNYDWNDYKEDCFKAFSKIDNARNDDNWISDADIYNMLLNIIQGNI